MTPSLARRTGAPIIETTGKFGAVGYRLPQFPDLSTLIRHGKPLAQLHPESRFFRLASPRSGGSGPVYREPGNFRISRRICPVAPLRTEAELFSGFPHGNALFRLDSGGLHDGRRWLRGDGLLAGAADGRTGTFRARRGALAEHAARPRP